MSYRPYRCYQVDTAFVFGGPAPYEKIWPSTDEKSGCHYFSRTLHEAWRFECQKRGQRKRLLLVAEKVQRWRKKKSEFKISLLFSSGLRKQKIVKSIDSLENNGFGRRESEKERHKRKKGKSKFKYLGSFFL